MLLFIHGGDNADGMGAMFDGDILAAHGQIIVITINYRVGVLGKFKIVTTVPNNEPITFKV